MQNEHYKVIFLFLLLCSVEIVGKRGGGGGARGGGGFGRGGSAARASSASRGGGLFGGSGNSRSGGASGGSWTAPKPNYGQTGGGGFSNTFGKGTHGGSAYRTPSFSRGSGVGSHSRGNTFKNMIIGAAAGVIAYEAGKAIIRSVASPMHWGGRNYYWGSQYYPGGGMSSGRTMCRMPVDPSDPQFGNVFLPGGQSRPKEIVWSCNYNEQCCGYECCPSGGYGGWNSRPGVGMGTIFLFLLLCICAVFILKHFYDKKRERDAETEERAKYQQGNVSFSVPTEPPPPYGFNVASA
ncbi:hypothetical protein niasHS_010496 [Heterodera schachtii]|uniref:CX domain-containing protein n=1 Tax=Heterodera schachtii TaxID=97005 RepID=A0ABD2IRR0_HETSC